MATSLEANGVVVYDLDQLLNYEKPSLMRKMIDFIWIPFLNLLPKRLGFNLVKMSSHDAKVVQKYATSFRALEVMYNYNSNNNIDFFREKGLRKFCTIIWQNTHNAQAVRNRLKLVTRELEKSILHAGSNNVGIFSLAAGSARAVFAVINKFKSAFPEIRIEAVLLDKHADALDFSRGIAIRYNLLNQFTYIIDNVKNLKKYKFKYRTDVVEMVGLLDYFDRQNAMELFKSIYDFLEPGNFFITGNIKKNSEEAFIKKSIGWEGMIYRSESDLLELFINAGFKKDKIKIYIEPQNIHMIAVAYK